MRLIFATLIILVLAALSLLTAGQAGLLVGSPPHNLGVVNGKLRPPSDTPNSVTSQADLHPDSPQKEYSSIAPLSYSVDAGEAMSALAAVLEHTEGTVIIKKDADYIYAQSTTKLLRFTDDLEFWLDRENQVIQLRSASRLGRKDMGKNRERIESIRQSLKRALAAT